MTYRSGAEKFYDIFGAKDDVAFYGDHDKAPFTEESESMVIITEKRGEQADTSRKPVIG